MRLFLGMYLPLMRLLRGLMMSQVMAGGGRPATAVGYSAARCVCAFQIHHCRASCAIKADTNPPPRTNTSQGFLRMRSRYRISCERSLVTVLVWFGSCVGRVIWNVSQGKRASLHPRFFLFLSYQSSYS